MSNFGFASQQYAAGRDDRAAQYEIAGGDALGQGIAAAGQQLYQAHVDNQKFQQMNRQLNIAELDAMGRYNEHQGRMQEMNSRLQFVQNVDQVAMAKESQKQMRLQSEQMELQLQQQRDALNPDPATVRQQRAHDVTTRALSSGSYGGIVQDASGNFSFDPEKQREYEKEKLQAETRAEAGEKQTDQLNSLVSKFTDNDLFQEYHKRLAVGIVTANGKTYEEKVGALNRLSVAEDFETARAEVVDWLGGSGSSPQRQQQPGPAPKAGRVIGAGDPTRSRGTRFSASGQVAGTAQTRGTQSLMSWRTPDIITMTPDELEAKQLPERERRVAEAMRGAWGDMLHWSHQQRVERGHQAFTGLSPGETLEPQGPQDEKGSFAAALNMQVMMLAQNAGWVDEHGTGLHPDIANNPERNPFLMSMGLQAESLVERNPEISADQLRLAVLHNSVSPGGFHLTLRVMNEMLGEGEKLTEQQIQSMVVSWSQDVYGGQGIQNHGPGSAIPGIVDEGQPMPTPGWEGSRSWFGEGRYPSEPEVRTTGGGF